MLCRKTCRTGRILLQDEAISLNFLHKVMPSRRRITEDIDQPSKWGQVPRRKIDGRAAFYPWEVIILISLLKLVNHTLISTFCFPGATFGQPASDNDDTLPIHPHILPPTYDPTSHRNNPALLFLLSSFLSPLRLDSRYLDGFHHCCPLHPSHFHFRENPHLPRSWVFQTLHSRCWSWGNLP